MLEWKQKKSRVSYEALHYIARVLQTVCQDKEKGLLFISQRTSFLSLVLGATGSGGMKQRSCAQDLPAEQKRCASKSVCMLTMHILLSLTCLHEKTTLQLGLKGK